jgi:hypothetical protein
MFARMAINHPVCASDAELLPWFEEAAKLFTIQLHRPS